jgi:hypothetical protein
MITSREAMDVISKFLYLANNIGSTYRTNCEDIGIADAETQDYLHALRFSKFDACKGYKLAKELQIVQQRRGELKDTNYILKFAKDFVEDNPSTIESIRVLMNQMNQAKKFQVERVYRPRVHHELDYGDAIKHAQR